MKGMKFIKYVYRRLRIGRIRSLANRKAKSLEIKGTVMVIAPHPDDEILGCGGWLTKAVQEGIQVEVVILTGGEKSHAGCCQEPESHIQLERRKLATGAAKQIGLPEARLHLLNYPDGNISPAYPETESLSELIEKVAPSTILIPHPLDGWQDHIQAGKIVKQLVQHKNIRLLQYCVWFWFNPYFSPGSLPWRQSYLCSLTLGEQQRKKQLVQAYMKALAPCGKPYSGTLPALLLKACCWKKELYFEENKTTD